MRAHASPAGPFQKAIISSFCVTATTYDKFVAAVLTDRMPGTCDVMAHAVRHPRDPSAVEGDGLPVLFVLAVALLAIGVAIAVTLVLVTSLHIA